MATPVTNTFTTDDQVGVRESISDIIVKVDPVTTPLYSNLRKTRAKSPLHEFQSWTSSEAPPVNIDYKLEGEQPDRNIAEPNLLLNNPTSILSKDYLVSGTLAAVDVAGRPNEMAWQRTVRALDLRAQVESALLADNIKVLTDSPRENAGLPNYADGGNGSALNTILTPAHTPDALETSMQLLKGKGVVGRTVLMLPANKSVFSATAATASAKNVEAAFTSRMPPLWFGAVSVYLTDLGVVQMVVDRYLDETLDASFVFDDKHLAVAEVPGRAFVEKPLGQVGDALQRLLVWEGTLEAGSPSSIATMGAFA